MVNSLTLFHLVRLLKCEKDLRFFYQKPFAPTLVELEEYCLTTGLKELQFQENILLAQTYANKSLEEMSRKNIKYVDFWNLDYPCKLKCLENPPWGIFYLGNLPKQIKTLSVVGSRRPNHYGIELIKNILGSFQSKSIQHISGLAYGIDTLAHLKTLQKSIHNFAVLGCGLDTIYPRENFNLAKQILENDGGILSEHPPHTKPISFHFPKRNRIIAALADVVWLPVGTVSSGSKYTMDYAIALGKSVCASPGDTFSSLSMLPNHYISNGIQPILCSDDLDLMISRLYPYVSSSSTHCVPVEQRGHPQQSSFQDPHLEVP